MNRALPWKFGVYLKVKLVAQRFQEFPRLIYWDGSVGKTNKLRLHETIIKKFGIFMLKLMIDDVRF